MTVTNLITAETVQAWLVAKIAHRLETDPRDIDVERYFDDFDLDSTEALVLAGELEAWLGFELEATALWYYPTISVLAEHIAEANAERVR